MLGFQLQAYVVTHQDILIEISEISLKKRILQLFFRLFQIHSGCSQMMRNVFGGGALGLRTSFLGC